MEDLGVPRVATGSRNEIMRKEEEEEEEEDTSWATGLLTPDQTVGPANQMRLSQHSHPHSHQPQEKDDSTSTSTRAAVAKTTYAALEDELRETQQQLRHLQQYYRGFQPGRAAAGTEYQTVLHEGAQSRAQRENRLLMEENKALKQKLQAFQGIMQLQDQALAEPVDTQSSDSPTAAQRILQQ